ncbi:YgzB family protein [Mechercharimyces sp. CAU 1602]|uniref:YgzB family protein n=1 Tax=Mechercharimyces sp. CAU 1602 TaxID=2973933 RepID=UPI0021639B2C|nr:YgzB family protein [Mechercharimyces sp. CAU 1602]MCS1352789.1 YgzB family protein [Mechercharimyces sp. CAU 1602]
MLSGKLNKIRTFALLLIFIGFGIMYLGFLWPKAMPIFFIFGMLAVFASVGIYFWIGTLSTNAPKVKCPQCHRVTKLLGKTDECMYCKAILSVDPKHAPMSDHDVKQ